MNDTSLIDLFDESFDIFKVCPVAKEGWGSAEFWISCGADSFGVSSFLSVIDSNSVEFYWSSFCAFRGVFVEFRKFAVWLISLLFFITRSCLRTCDSSSEVYGRLVAKTLLKI